MREADGAGIGTAAGCIGALGGFGAVQFPIATVRGTAFFAGTGAGVDGRAGALFIICVPGDFFFTGAGDAAFGSACAVAMSSSKAPRSGSDADVASGDTGVGMTGGGSDGVSTSEGFFVVAKGFASESGDAVDAKGLTGWPGSRTWMLICASIVVALEALSTGVPVIVPGPASRRSTSGTGAPHDAQKLADPIRSILQRAHFAMAPGDDRSSRGPKQAGGQAFL